MKVINFIGHKLFDGLPDDLYLKLKFRYRVRRKLDLLNPKTYSEKLQWLKINDRKPIYTRMVDKFEVKKLVADIVGEEYIIPTLGVWNSAEEIDFDILPQKFVLKCTHDSGSIIICKDKESLSFKDVRSKLAKSLKKDAFVDGREWPYKNVPRKIIAEKYMEDLDDGELRDYKLFTFHGIPRIMHLVTNRQNKDEETYGDCFDMDFNHLDLTMGHNNNPILPEKPVNFELMKEFARKLSEGTKHLRVDFYEVNGHLYFGELTFYENSGFFDVEPSEWNAILGSWIDLNY